MSSTNTKTTDKNATLQGKAEFHAEADRDKNISTGSNDYMTHQRDTEGIHKNVSADKDKNEKTTLTFEKKTEKVKDEDKDMKDLSAKKDFSVKKDFSAKKDVSTKHESSGEGKGILNTIKDKVMDVLGSGDNDKDKDLKEKNKELEKDKHKDWEKKDKFVSSEHDKNVGISSDKYSSNLGATSGQQHYSNLGATSGQQHSSNLGSSNIGSDKYVSSGSDKYASGGIGSDKYVSSGSDKFAAHSGVVGASQAETINRTGLGAEHKEVGYDKYSGVIPSKSADKEKDSGHKLDIHASVKTGSAAGSTSGSQASTFKTTESK